jgi:hypothetical protein
VLSVKEGIIQRRKTNVQRRINWNSKNIADFAEHTHRIKKPSKIPSAIFCGLPVFGIRAGG